MSTKLSKGQKKKAMKKRKQERENKSNEPHTDQQRSSSIRVADIFEKRGSVYTEIDTRTDKVFNSLNFEYWGHWELKNHRRSYF